MTWKNFSTEQAAARFDSSEDLTIGIEEEFQILDPDSLELTNSFNEVYRIAHPVLGPHVTGELIASEIEINTCKCDGLREAEADLVYKRQALAEVAGEVGVALVALGTHPYSNWKDQQILDTAHYREVEERLKYLAWRNLTYGMHVHVGIRGRERMIAVFNAMRGFMPYLLALSANSPFSEGVYTYLHSTRAQIFTRSFPRCNIPNAFRDWDDYSAFVSLLFATNSISDPLQMWWSLRPHPMLGTLEIRICDSQITVRETMAVASLAVALIAQLGDDYDHGKVLPLLDTNQLDENLWRAIRYGLDGNMVDFEAGREVGTCDMIRRQIDYAGEQWARLGAVEYMKDIYDILNQGNGAQRQIRAYHEQGDIRSIFRGIVYAG